MAGEGLVLHIGVDGANAKKEAAKLVKEIQGQLSGVTIDFSGKGALKGRGGSGIKDQIRKAGKEAAAEIKNQQRIITQVTESGIRASQASLKRIQDRQTVDAARANRGADFDPMLPFMNPMLSGRGLSGRTKNRLREYKDRLRQEQRERDQILREQMSDQTRSMRDQERQQRQYMRSQQGLARQRAREEEALSRRMQAAGADLNAMVDNPWAANFSAEGIKHRKAYVLSQVQGPRLARQQQAQRSAWLAEEARRLGKGFNRSDYIGRNAPVGFQTDKRTQRGVAGMFEKHGVYRANDMRNANRFGHRGNMIGMGAYQMQQMFEDYQYAGIRGLGNNMAFMGASIGGPAGMGIIGGALALQVAELTYKMLGYAEAQEKAAKASEILTKRQLEFIDVSHDVNARFASGESDTQRRYDLLTENPEKRAARERIAKAYGELAEKGMASGGRFRITNDAMSNPEKYLEYASGLGENVPAMRQSRKDAEVSLRDALQVQAYIDDVKKKDAEFQAARRNADYSAINAGSRIPEMDATRDLAEQDAIAAREAARKAVGMHYPKYTQNLAKLGTRSSWIGTDEFEGTALGVQTTIDEMESRIALSDKRLSEVVARISTPGGADMVSKELMDKLASGDKSAFDLASGFLGGDKEIRKLVEEYENAEKLAKKAEQAEIAVAQATAKRRWEIEAIQDAEEANTRLVKTQLSLAEDMAAAAERRVSSITGAKQRSSDSFAGRSFELNRDRTSAFLEQAGAPDWYIQQQDDMIVQGRLNQLRGAATAAGKAGDTDRQIEMLQELQDLQMSMASSDSRFGVAEGFYNASFATQAEIEAAYQKQVQAATSQQQAWQGVVNSLQQAQNIKIDPLSPDALPKLQQYLSMVQAAQVQMNALNPGMGAAFSGAMGGALGAVQDATGATEWYNLFGVGGDYTSIPKARGGMIGGMGNNDTVNAVLKPHEYVIRSEVVKRLGAATFEHINRTGTLPKRMASGGMWNGRKPWWYENWNRYNSQRWEVQAETARRGDFWERIRQYPPGDKFGIGGTIYHGDEHDRVMEMYDRRARGAAKQQAYWDLFGIAPNQPKPSMAGAGGAAGGVGGYAMGGSGSAAGSAGTARKTATPRPSSGTARFYGGITPRAGTMGWGTSGFAMLPGMEFGSVLSMAAPVIAGRTYRSSGGFADRIMRGNYSGGQDPNSWWGAPSWRRFARMGTAVYSSGGGQATDMSWLNRARGRRFATGGLVSPIAPPDYGSLSGIIATASRGGYSGSMPSRTVNNRSNIGSININVVGSGAAGRTIDEARRAEHASKLRRG